MLISPKASLVKLLPAVIPEADEPQALPARVISPGTSLIRSSRPLMPSAIETGTSEEHTSELQSLMRISYAVFCLIKKTHTPSTKPLFTRNGKERHDTTPS